MANLTTIVDNQIVESTIDETAVITTASGLSSLSDVVLTAPANGDFLMYNGTDWVDSTAVTSVSLSVPTGFTVSGVPITTTGTIGLDLDTGYSLINNTTQTITGSKTFSSAPTFSTMTEGSVLFAGTSGVVSQKNANLFWDNTNNRLGLGTVTPSYPLHIVHNNDNYVSGIVVQNNNTTNTSFSSIILNNSSSVTVGQFVYLPSNYGNAGLQNTVLFASVGTQKLAFVANTSGAVGQDIYFATAGTKYNIYLYGSTGNVVIQNGGSFTDAGFRLDVNGTARISGNTTIANGVEVVFATTGGGSGTYTVNGQATQTLQYTARMNPGSATLTAGASYANYLFDVATITEAPSGTHQIVSNVYIRPVTLVNGTGTASLGASLYIENAPSGVTFGTASYSLWVDDGLSRLDGGVAIGGSSGSGSNLYVVGTTGSANNAMSIGGVATNSRVVIHQSAAPSMGSNNYASLIVQGSAFVSNTHAIIAAAAIKAPTISISGGTATNGVALYVEGATTLATNNYAVWVDDGTVRLDAAFELQGIANTTTSNVLYYDTTTKRVTYGTAPSGSGGYTVTNQTTTYNATATSGTLIVKCDTTAGAFTVNLPTAVGNTATIIIKKTAGSAALTVDAATTETIDGGLTATINKVYESITLISDNANWQIV